MSYCIKYRKDGETFIRQKTFKLASQALDWVHTSPSIGNIVVEIYKTTRIDSLQLIRESNDEIGYL